MNPWLVPRLLELLNRVWFGLALLLLLKFTWVMTGFMAYEYGALAAATVFLVLALSVLYAIHFATRRPVDHIHR